MGVGGNLPGRPVCRLNDRAPPQGSELRITRGKGDAMAASAMTTYACAETDEGRREPNSDSTWTADERLNGSSRRRHTDMTDMADEQ